MHTWNYDYGGVALWEMTRTRKMTTENQWLWLSRRKYPWKRDKWVGGHGIKAAMVLSPPIIIIALTLGDNDAEPRAKFFREFKWVLPSSKF